MELVSIRTHLNILNSGNSNFSQICMSVKPQKEGSDKQEPQSFFTDFEKNVEFENTMALTSTVIDADLAKDIANLTAEKMMESGSESLIQKLTDARKEVCLKLL